MDFNSNIPIYLQIVDEFKRKIVTKEYVPSQKVESVRELALTLGVNPNTVQKALAELERQGIVYTNRTTGRYISDNSELITTERIAYINIKVNEFICEMKKMGFDKEQIIEIMKGEN
ncbi:MAG: GntR family transcriptional regulator [Erysipelotrichaceae bacterium]